MINEKALISLPFSFKNICVIFPPKIKDVIGNEDFAKFKHILTISQEDIEDEIAEREKKTGKKIEVIPTPFQYLMDNCAADKGFTELAKKAFFFFTHQRVNILVSGEQEMIVFGDLEKLLKEVTKIEELSIINKDNYFEFQNEIRKSLGNKAIEPPNPNEHPRIKRMKAKARYRDRIKQKNGQGISLGTSLCSICCMGLGLNPLNIGEMSFAAIDPIIHTYQEKEKYDTDIRTLQAGGDAKKIKPKYWIRNLED